MCSTRYGWANMLYLNNIIPYDDIMFRGCAIWTWYLACDMQFYIVA